jgi:hypothetical protein|eukprot:EG_transcript_29492
MPLTWCVDLPGPMPNPAKRAQNITRGYEYPPSWLEPKPNPSGKQPPQLLERPMYAFFWQDLAPKGTTASAPMDLTSCFGSPFTRPQVPRHPNGSPQADTHGCQWSYCQHQAAWPLGTHPPLLVHNEPKMPYNRLQGGPVTKRSCR